MKLGFYTDWHDRGVAYQAKPVVDLALDLGHEVSIFPRYGSSPTWEGPVYKRKNVKADDFSEWHTWTKTQDRIIVFESFMPVEDVPADIYVNYEMLHPHQFRSMLESYEHIICPTIVSQKSLADCIRQIEVPLSKPASIDYLPWVSDMKYQESHGEDFFFNGGWGGVNNRRNGPLVAEAALLTFLACGEKFKFTYKTQIIDNSFMKKLGSFKLISGNLGRDDMIKLYQESGIVVAPSQVEGYGLTFLEALYCGLPVLTVDSAPMNEHVQPGRNGWLIPCEPVGSRGLATVVTCQVIDLLRVMIDLVSLPEEVAKMQESTRKWARRIIPENEEKFREYWVKLWSD